jgi:Family of unknown function (DUF6113)
MTGISGGRSAASLVTGAAYVVLLLLGVVEGAIGSFQYSRLVPAGAILFCIGILLTCLLGGWAMGSVSGAFLPAFGWLVASFVLSMPVSNGSVIITNSEAGKWYLYGGTLSVAIAVVISFTGWLRILRR